MEDRLAKYIVNVAGASYLLMGCLFFGILLLGKDNPFEDSLFVKSLILLIVYVISLVLIHVSKGKSLRSKAIMWGISIVLHLGIMGYIIYQFGDITALVLMLAECVILVLQLIGISSIGFQIFKGAKQKA
ncbi:MAG: hypothetical protein GY695_11125 [Aestuariibacter sp.]|jgi:hypothetical protein|nr:hypothetical protein [Aestuariibacter sp.]MCP4058831.1 hypothetical protein [Pseudoalteromonas sp.]